MITVTPFAQDSGTGNGELKRVRAEESRAVPPSARSEQRDEMLQLYKLQMPEDLYHFWDFCKELCPDNPRGMRPAATLRLAAWIPVGGGRPFFCPTG